MCGEMSSACELGLSQANSAGESESDGLGILIRLNKEFGVHIQLYLLAHWSLGWLCLSSPSRMWRG